MPCSARPAGRRPRPGASRRRASASSAASTSAGSSPLSIAPLRIASGSSRSRCRPTLTRLLPGPWSHPGAASRSRRTTNARSRLASSQPARGPFGPPEEGEVERRERPSRREPEAGRGREDRRLPGSPPLGGRPGLRPPRRHGPGERAEERPLLRVEAARFAPAAPRERPSGPAPARRSRARPGRPAAAPRGFALVRGRGRSPSPPPSSAGTSAAGTWTRNARWENARPEGRRLGRDVGVGVAEGVAEDRREAGRQVALDLAPGGRGGEPVELVEQARDRVGALGVELDGVVRPGPDEERPELLRREDLDDLVGGGAAALGGRHLPAADVQELVRHVDRRLALEHLAGDRVGAVPRAARGREVLAARLDRHPEQAPLGRPLEVPGELARCRRTATPSRASRSHGPR